MTLPRFSIGTGDRFGMEGRAQLAALEAARAAGFDVGIVWNKSAREHAIIHSSPADQRDAAAAAVSASGWRAPWFVDADHVGLKTVDAFAPHCDFFTIDVADFIGLEPSKAEVEAFVARHARLVAERELPARIDAEALRSAASRYLVAVKEAGKVYRRIVELRGEKDFVAEVSMDETSEAQSPAELLAILAAISDEGIPLSTIAPKFSGRFNKGVDYVGDAAAFLSEFEADIRVTQYAVKAFGLPAGLKLSIHSGSDKFSLYPGIAAAARRLGAGFHLKTAGTTWLEELIGLAEAGGSGLAIAKEIYRGSFGRYEELVGPYAAVVDIDRPRLPSPETVETWDGKAYAAALRHDRGEPRYDRGFRQLLHVGYKVAAEAGPRFLSAIAEHRDSVSRNVTTNLLERHLRPLLGF